MSQENKIRLDKWLWACRFYKTRALAKTAIDGGKILYQGQKPKSSKNVQLGDTVKIRIGFDERSVTVIGLSDKRGSASIAQTLYQESDDSLRKREEMAKLRKMSGPTSTTKPDKKQRRVIHRFKNIHDYSSD